MTLAVWRIPAHIRSLPWRVFPSARQQPFVQAFTTHSSAHPATLPSTTGMSSSDAHEPTPTLVVKAQSPQESEFETLLGSKIVPALLADGVIGVPTDTIYGLAACAQSTEGIKRIYQIKGRDEKKPIAICVDTVAMIHDFANVTVPDSLLQALLPGPVTLVFTRKPALNHLLNPHTDLIGIRIPKYPIIQRIVSAVGQPLALTSANRSSEPSTLEPSEFSHLWSMLDVVVDGGKLSDSRAGSTVVDLSNPGQYSIIREGSALHNTLAILHHHALTAA